jgi:polysaccharide biosynthesis transport protein
MLTQSGNAGGALVTGHESEEQHRNVFRLLWRRKWGIFTVVLLCVGGAALYLHRAPLVFTSEARVFVQQPDSGPAGDPGQVNNADSYLYLQSEMIKSELLLKFVPLMPEVAALPSIAGQANPVRVLQSNLDVEVDNHLSVISIKYSSRTADEAVTVVNAILKQYTQSHADPTSANSSSKEVLGIVVTEQKEQAAKLLIAQDKVTDFKSAHQDMTFVSDKGNIVIDKLTVLSNELTAAQMLVVNAKAEFTEVQSLKDSAALWPYIKANPLPNDSDIATAAALGGEIETQDMLTRKLMLRLGPKALDVIDSQATLMLYQQKLQEFVQSACANYVSTIQQKYNDATRHSDDLAKEYESQLTMAKNLYGLQTQLEVLQEDVSREQKLSDAIDTRINELRAKQVEEVLNVQVLQRGDKQQLDISPRYYRTMGMAGIMGLVLGLVCAFLLDMTDGRIHSVEEVRSSLGMRVLGAIPHVRGVHLVTNLGRGVDLYPAAEIAEAFRIVRTAIHLKMQARRTRPILVTSPQQGEGKTVVSSNLAIAMAKSGRRTILVDADMRSPMMHCIHTVSNARGLFNVLCGELTVSQAVLPSGIDRLDIMPAGPTPPNPAELLNDIRFNQMVKDLCAAYDAVIIDAPPVIPVADPAIISAWCKTTILVMRARKSNLKEGQESLDRLAAAGASVLGVVVNDVPQRHGQYGYYGSASAPRPRRALPTVSTGTTTTAKSTGPQRVELIDPDGAVRYAHEDQDEDGNGRANSNGNGHGNGNGHSSVAINSNGNGSADSNGNGNGAAH